MEPIDPVGPGGGNDALVQAALQEVAEGVIFIILDVVFFEPLRGELMNVFEDDQSSSTYF
jgi:hypothetical protein